VITPDIEAYITKPVSDLRAWLDLDGQRLNTKPTPSSTIKPGHRPGVLLLDRITESSMGRIEIHRVGFVGQYLFDHLYESSLELEALRARNRELEQEASRLQEQHRLSLDREFGTSSEKVKPEGDASSVADPCGDQCASMNNKPKKRGAVNAGRKPLPDTLPVQETRSTLTECKHCGSDSLVEIGSDTSSELVIVPESFYVRQRVRLKYVCRCCNRNSDAAAPPRALRGTSYGSPEFASYVAVQKYCFGMPLYRQAKRLNSLSSQTGLKFNRTTLANLMIGASDAFTQIYEYMKDELRSQPAMHADETVLQVLREPGKTAQSMSYLWGYRSVQNADKPVIIFEYNPSRAGSHAAQFLNPQGAVAFKGYLHTDGYAGYNKLASVTRIGCAAHVRRKFEKVYKAVGSLDASGGLAAEMLNLFRKLYAVERDVSELPSAERAAVRTMLAAPVLKEMFEWLDRVEPAVLPKSALGQAISYARDQLPAVARYLDDGTLALDNNIMERAIKMVVIGRKNYLFATSQDGATANAVLYSVVQTAEANGIDPYRYLVTVLERVASSTCKDDYLALMPWALRAELGYPTRASRLAA
jgi:transposase